MPRDLASGPAATLPDIDRPDVEVAVVHQHAVETSGQRQLAAATLAAWDSGPWPEGLVSRTCYVSVDGQRVLTYEQWRAGDAAQVPPDAIAFRLYRSGVRDDAPVPGCIVIVEVQTDGPETARKWVDAVFDALAAETTLHPGGISGHFHISLDGTRVLNYAEWLDEASHVEALGQAGSIGRGPAWRRVQSMPGVENRGFRRYSVYGLREGSNLPRHDV
jgi:Antibiotic biosynthesis monooxygenase